MAHTLVGRNGWLFLCEDSNHVYNQHAGKRKLTAEDLERFAAILEASDATFRELGIPYLYVSVPYKERIYHTEHPIPTDDANLVTCIDRIIDRVGQPNRYHLLDLKHTLLEHKYKGRLYRQNDTHWNRLGAFYGYQEIMRALAARDARFNVPDERDYNVTLEPFEGGDLSAPKIKKMIAGDTFVPMYPQPADVIEHIPVITHRHGTQAREVEPPATMQTRNERPTRAFTTGNASLPNAVIFRTSSTDDLLTFLPEHFNNSYFVWLTAIDFDVVREFKPDIVLHIFEDRYLTYAAGFDPTDVFIKRCTFIPLPPSQAQQLAVQGITGLVTAEAIADQQRVEYALENGAQLVGSFLLHAAAQIPTTPSAPLVIYYDFGEGFTELARHKIGVEKERYARIDIRKPCRKIRIMLPKEATADNCKITFRQVG